MKNVSIQPDAMLIAAGKSDNGLSYISGAIPGAKPEGKTRAGDVSPIGGMAKRVFDIALAIVAIVLLSPLLFGVAMLIKLTSPGPVFYGHARVGFNGRLFKCWKFRTMVVNSDAVLARHLRDDPEAWREWDETFKLRDDPRVLPLGRVLRKLSIDELPQLYNILIGEMSVVGPRPVVKAELQRYGSAVRHYIAARPGLTGLWQVSGRSDTSYRLRTVLDRFYVARQSLLLDIWIVIRTVPAVLASRGAC